MKKATEKRIFKVAVLLVSTLVSIAILEVSIRVFFPHYDPKRQIRFFENSDGVRIGPKEESVRQRTPKGDFDIIVSFNKYGLRDEKNLAQSNANDLLVVGDSFTFGFGVEVADRFSNILEERLGRPVFNVSAPTGIAGYRRLISYARKSGGKSGNLIIGVCMENDLKTYQSLPTQAPLRHRERSISDKTRLWGKTHSAIYLALSVELQEIPAIRGILEYLGIVREIDELTGKNSMDQGILISSRDQLITLIEEAQASEAVVLIIPSRALWYGTNRREELWVHEQFVALLKAEGVKVLDMRPVFERSEDPLEYYFDTDPHWNERGHEAAAEALFGFVIESGI